MLRPHSNKKMADDASRRGSWGDLPEKASGTFGAAREAVARGLLECAHARSKRGGSSINGSGHWIRRSGFFDFGDKDGADNGRIGETTENGDMAGKGNAKTNGKG